MDLLTQIRFRKEQNRKMKEFRNRVFNNEKVNNAVCLYCNREFKNENGLNIHLRTCKEKKAGDCNE